MTQVPLAFYNLISAIFSLISQKSEKAVISRLRPRTEKISPTEAAASEAATAPAGSTGLRTATGTVHGHVPGNSTSSPRITRRTMAVQWSVTRAAVTRLYLTFSPSIFLYSETWRKFHKLQRLKSCLCTVIKPCLKKQWVSLVFIRNFTRSSTRNQTMS